MLSFFTRSAGSESERVPLAASIRDDSIDRGLHAPVAELSPRGAFEAKDGFGSKLAHDLRASAGYGAVAKDANGIAPAEAHKSVGSEVLKSIVFGGIDGIITTFSTLASVAGGDLSVGAGITLGFANLIADGIAMGLGDFLSSQAEFEHLVAERKREAWEFDNYPEGERAEMEAHLVEKGFEEGDAREIISIIAAPAHKSFFVDFMMTEELGLEIPDDPWGPLKDGTATLLSFAVFGSIPLWVYLILYAAGYTNKNGVFGAGCGATVLTLVALGLLQGYIARINLFRSALYMTINGSLASAAAYAIGWGLARAVGNGSSGSC